ncbi:MAG: phosphotransferase family protein [Acidobacteria bacterium]|nr:phosphotransferase family protein [Acidobacteriota bacterium]
MKDTKPIRPGEELNIASLSEYLEKNLTEFAEKLDFSQIEILQFPGGHSNLTYLIKIGSQEFVLRRPPFGPVAPTAHDMPREFRLLSMIHPEFNLAPRPFLLCEDLKVIGVPFYLMERKKGWIIRRSLPEGLILSSQERYQISLAMIDTLAKLHSVDIYTRGLDKIGKPVGFLSRQVKGWSERWQRAKTTDVKDMETVMLWLNEHMPKESLPPTLVHNDFKLDNVILDAQNPSKVIGVLDWEMSTVGDPLIDLGIFLGYWSQAKDSAARRESISPITCEEGWASREDLITRYAEQTGRDLSEIAFYETFALFKLAVVLQQIYYRYACGQTKDERFKEFEQVVIGLANAAIKLIN